ncbi:flavin reductase family protein [Actinosynnema sp. CS-041913]|uniref:flavin reductase family protein n=1 Tax=Actinosynnema sp. CS-041913 TaxID=3239917 RepID=UPI003D8D0C90
MTAVETGLFRHVLGHVPTSVVVVTALESGRPAGMAVGSFVSVSLDPPLVGFFPSRSSSSWPKIRQAGRFGVNVLGEHQHETSRTFATRGADKFADTRWHRGTHGTPLLDGAIATLECDLVGVTDVGDHYFALGRVLSLHATGDTPLVFFRGDYARLA